MRAVLQLGLGTLGLVAELQAQSTLLDIVSSAGGENAGQSVASLADLNADGMAEFLVGAPLALNPSQVPAGAVRVHSGANGQVLRSHYGLSANEQFGVAVLACGDLNSDGLEDYCIGSEGAGRVIAYSGLDGAVLWQQVEQSSTERFGFALAAVQDLNQDGRAEILVGAPGCDVAANDAGAAYLLSGLDGSVLRVLLGSGLSTELGYAIASGDVDGDGFADAVLGTASGSNWVEVRSLVSGALIRSHTGGASLDWFGTAVAVIGDTNADGCSEVLIGASQGLLGPGYAQLYSGIDGNLLHTQWGAANLDLFGWSLAGPGDVDGDGHADYLIGAPFGEGPSGEANLGVVRFYSGASGALFAASYGPSSDSAFGWSLQAQATRPAIGGAPAHGSGGAARVLDTQQSPGWSNYCVLSPNSVGPGSHIDAQGSPSVALDQLLLMASGAPANTFGLFFYGRYATQVPFGNGTRCVASPFFRRPVLNLNSNGSASQLFSIANLPAPARPKAGELWRFQFWHRDAAAGGAFYTASDALKVRFGP